MTYSLRRKHQITARGPRWLARIAISLLGAGFAFSASNASAQTYPSQGGQMPVQSVQFHRDAVPPNAPAVHSSSPMYTPVSNATFDDQGMRKQVLPKSYYDEAAGFRGLREVPGLEVLTRAESEAEVKERMRQEAWKAGERIAFPDEPVLSKTPYQGRRWAPKLLEIEPAYVAHGRLLFEQKNFERGLWDLGPLTPVVCVGLFYADVLSLPYHIGTRPCQQYDTGAGKCLPGDPAPFYLYPPEWSFSGLVTQVVVVTGLLFIFP